MKSILMIGLGRFGRHMAKKFIENGHEVLAIDSNEERADGAVGFIQQILIGENFQTVLEITVLLKDLNCRYVVARATRDVHRKLLLRNGADYVVYAEREVAERLAIKFGADNIFDYVELTPEIGIYEIAVPKPWLGKSMVELSIRNRYHVSVMATKKNEHIFPLPDPHHVFEANESIMVMGSAEALQKLT